MRVSHQLILSVAAIAAAAAIPGCDQQKGTGPGATRPTATTSHGPAESIDTDPNKLLFRALVLYRDADEVTRLLTAHPELVEKQISGLPPLSLACDANSLPVVQAFVEKKADVNARDIENRSVLWAAVKRGNIPIVKYLVEHGADVKALQDDKETLLWAAETREMAEFLIAAGLDPKHKNINGDTALHVSCRHSLTPVVELLLDKGLDIEAKGHWDMRPLHTAAATETGDPKDVVLLLLRRGANIDAKGFKGHTALHECAFYNRQSMAELLLARGANPNIKDDDGRTPYDLAFFAGRDDRARLINALVNRGALDADGKPALKVTVPKDY